MNARSFSQVLCLLAGFLWFANAHSLSCGPSNANIDDSLKSLFESSDLVIRGRMVRVEFNEYPKVKAEGIWKGPDSGIYDVGGFWFAPPLDGSFVVLAWEEESEGKKHYFFNASCLMMAHDLSHSALLDKAEELFGQAKKPSPFVRNLLSAFLLFAVFATLIGISFLTYKHVSLNKSSKGTPDGAS